MAAETKIYSAVVLLAQGPPVRMTAMQQQQGEPHLNKHISICTLPTGELSSESDKINE